MIGTDMIQEIKELFDKFETCNNEQFIYYLKELQPEKKNWTNAKLNYWFYIDYNDGQNKPIKGILSKLAGIAVKDTPTGKAIPLFISFDKFFFILVSINSQISINLVPGLT